MANALKKAVFGFLDKNFAHEGRVVQIKKWEPAAMYEIDLHLPDVNMAGWKTIPRIKCKVDEFEYRDYSPALWDAKARTCTIFVETAHMGHGSRWAKNLEVGSNFLYAAAHAAPLPSRAGKILCLGDGSAIGHFLALKQLTERAAYPMEVVTFLNENYNLPESLIASNPELSFLMRPHGNCLNSLMDIVQHRKMSEYASIYISGHIPVIQGLRKVVKSIVSANAKVYAHGFW